MSTYPRWSASDLLADAALSWRRGLGGATLLNHYVLGFSVLSPCLPPFQQFNHMFDGAGYPIGPPNRATLVV